MESFPRFQGIDSRAAMSRRLALETETRSRALLSTGPEAEDLYQEAIDPVPRLAYGERGGVEWSGVQLPSARFCGWIVSPRASRSTNWVIRRARVSARLAFVIR